MTPKIAIGIYTTFGHIAKLAEAEKAGIEASGGFATIHQIAETLSDEILAKMEAPPKPAYPILAPDELDKFNTFLFGITARYGAMGSQWRSFWDATGRLWHQDSLAGKKAGLFVSTDGPGGGQEMMAISVLSTFVHMGIVYVPLGYGDAASSTDEVHVGSPWGAGVIAGRNVGNEPNKTELEIARIQGKTFYERITAAYD